MTTTVHVTVTVGAGGAISCSPDPVPVTDPNTLVDFDLATPGYAFPTSGAITVAASGTDFPYASWTTSSSSAALYDKNHVAGDYEYTVAVVDISDGSVITLDPVIHNTGHP